MHCQDWYSTQVCNHMDGPVAQRVDLSMSIVEPLGAIWLMKTLEANPSITRSSVEHCTPHADGAWLNELGWSQ